MSDSVVLSERTGRTAVLAALSALFTAGCLWMLASGFGEGRPVRAVVGVAGVLFFGAGTVLLLWRWLGGRSAVSAGPDGLRDRRVSADLIPWSAIQSMEFLDAGDPEILEVTVTVRPEYATRLRRGPIQRLQWSKNAGMPTVNISGFTLRGDLAGLAALLKHHHPGWTAVTTEELSAQVYGPEDDDRHRR